MYPDQSPAVQFERPVSAEDRQSFFNSLYKQSSMTWLLLPEPPAAVNTVPTVYELISLVNMPYTSDRLHRVMDKLQVSREQSMWLKQLLEISKKILFGENTALFFL